MNKSILIISTFTLAIANLQCHSSTPTEPSAPKGMFITLDRSSYYFSTQTFRDTLFMTLANNSDTTIISWFPTYLYFKADTGWELRDISDGAYYTTVAPTKKTTISWFVMTDSLLRRPNGTYQFNAEVHFRDSADSERFILVPSPEFLLTYK